MAETRIGPDNAIDVDLAGFREVVHHPQAHALILQ